MMNPIVPQPNPVYYQRVPPTIFADETEPELRNYLDTLFDHRWLILTVALVTALLGTVYAFMAKPVYEANMLIHVEQENDREAKNIVGEMGQLFDLKTDAASEMELVKSRLVVTSAIDELRLYLRASPNYFPVLGKMFAERSTGLSTPGLLGFGGWVWGKERVEVGSFEVPDKLLNHEFILTAQEAGRFVITEAKHKIRLNGMVGEPLLAQTENGPLQLHIAELHALPGAQFKLLHSSRLAMIESVQKDLQVAEMGKQSGVVSVSLKGSSPTEVHAILTAISNEYVRQNYSRKTEEASKTLASINRQLPELKQRLELSETRYNQYRNAHGTIDLGEEAKLSLQQSAAAKNRKMELEQRRTELLTRFTTNHPIVIGVNMQIREVNNEIRNLAAHIKGMPSVEQEVVRLARDVKVNSDLYTALLNTAQQLRLVTIGKMSNVRLVDSPMMPEKPVSPNRPKIIAVALMLGLFLGTVLAFLKNALRNGIDDPAEMEKILGVPVYATIPHSKVQQQLFDQVNRKSPRLPLLATQAPMDVAVEALRNFRTALQFSMSHTKNNIILITGPTPGMGKSFASVNLAAVLASSGKRVLLIDGDLRNGHLHRYFDLGRQDGLAEALAGDLRMEQVIHREVVESVDFVATGVLPPNPSELLLRPGLGKLLENMSPLYDYILIDSSPVLAVPDSLILGAHAGAIYLMTRSGVTQAGEIIESFKRLAQAGLSAKGVLFNDLNMRPGRYGYGYKYGNYRQLQYSYGPQQQIEASPGPH